MRQRGLDIPEELPITRYANAALFHRDLEGDVAVIGVGNCLNMSAGNRVTLSEDCLDPGAAAPCRRLKYITRLTDNRLVCVVHRCDAVRATLSQTSS